MQIDWPQGIFMSIMVMNVGVKLANHGKPRTGRENVWIELIGFAITVGLLSWGGFFGGH